MQNKDKFTGKSGIYAKYRPSYPQEYIDYLIQSNNLSDESVVADIGSGTGILTRQLLDQNLKVIAVEPNDDMRMSSISALKQYPRFVSINAFAENTTIENSSIDIITVAQAFHWFDKNRFKQECARILKSNANVALVWNSRDLNRQIIKENAEVCRKFCPDFHGFSGGIEDTPEIYAAFFREGKYEYKIFQNDIQFDLDGFIGRNLSASYAPKSTDANYNSFIQAIKVLFSKYCNDDQLTFPNLTQSYVGKV